MQTDARLVHLLHFKRLRCFRDNERKEREKKAGENAELNMTRLTSIDQRPSRVSALVGVLTLATYVRQNQSLRCNARAQTRRARGTEDDRSNRRSTAAPRARGALVVRNHLTGRSMYVTCLGHERVCRRVSAHIPACHVYTYAR